MWRKIHLAINESKKDVIEVEVTTADWGGNEVFPSWLTQVGGEVRQVLADGV